MIRHAIFLTTFFCFTLHSSTVLDILKILPAEDRQDLTYLFHRVFLQQDGAYTIFGNKPVSSAASFLIPLWEATLMGYPVKFSKSWNTWLKYKHKFPMKKYVIVSEKYTSKKSGSVAIYVYVIDKIKFIKIINNNLSLFEAVLHKKIDPEKLLNDIETEKSSFLASINNNEMLFGILLGYGKHNASLYEKSKLSRTARILFPEKVKLKCSDEETYHMMIVNPVQFMADLGHPETKALQKKYKNLRKRISDIYSQGDILEITLSQLIF